MHVMVCYDAVLPDMKISKAQHIIHFSLPNSWTMFTRRFACSFGYCKDPLREPNIGQYKPAASLVLLDENNNEQLPKLVEFLRIHDQEVAEPITKLTNVSSRIKNNVCFHQKRTSQWNYVPRVALFTLSPYDFKTSSAR